MALTDWTEKVGGDQITVTSARASAGSLSLQVDDADKYASITNDKSETDAPTEGRVQSETYIDDVSSSELSGGSIYRGGLAYIFRYVDSDNFYALIWWHQLTNKDRLSLVKRVGGSGSTVSTQSQTGTLGSFASHQVTFWEDGGTFFVRFEEDTGSGYSLVGSDFSDGANEHTEGGAIGFGLAGPATGNGFDGDTSDIPAMGGWWDEVELFY